MASKHRCFLLSFLVLLNVFSLIPATAQNDDCLPTQFSADDYYPMAVVTPGDSNNVRAEPSPSGELLGQVAAGEGMRIFTNEDPVCTNGYLWRRIATPQLSGWTVEASGDTYFIVPYQQPDPVVLTKPQDGSEWAVSEHGVTFSIPAALPFRQVSSSVQPFSLFTMAEFPSSLMFDFGERLSSTWPYPVNITVFDNKSAPDLLSDGEWLQTLLAEQQPLVAASRDEERLPQSPIVGRPMFIGAPTYLPFGSGQGLRYITSFSGEVALFNPESSVVVYRGLSDDGAYLIEMDMPVQLPPNVIPPHNSGRVPDANTLVAFEDTLTALPTSAFTPDLALFDAMFSSVRIADPDALDAALK